MDLLRPALPTHTKTPMLLRIPHDKEKEKDKENQRPIMPLLKVNLSKNVNNTKETNIFRLPTEYCNLPLNFQRENETNHPVHAPIPRLIDIRSIINPIKEKINSPRTKKDVQSKDIKLIRLPLVKSETTRRLLDSPKRKMSDVSRQKVVDKEQPLLVDIRPFTPQSPPSTQLLKNVKNVKMTSSINSSRRTSVKSPSHTLKSHYKLTETENDDDLSILNESDGRYKRKHKRRNKNHSEELFEVISELLMEHRKKKKKHKRFGLFDIIDNIPLSSDSEEDDIPLVRTRRGQKTNLDVRNKPIKTDVEIIKQSGLPDYTLDKFKPKSTFLDNKDALSWANIIKAARQETQGTQTERKISYVTKSIEIQTEMRGMVDIPRTQTFFKSSSEYVNKSTNEFCDRVRKEVVEKLDNLKKKEDKFCQTVCNAGIQTDEEIGTFGYYNVGDIKGTEISSQKSGQISHLPPDIHTEVYFHNNVTGVKKDFINVVDLDDVNKDLDALHKDVEVRNSDFFKLESIDEYVARISALDNVTMQDEQGAMETPTGESFEKKVNLENSEIAVPTSSDTQIADNDHVGPGTIILSKVDGTGSDQNSEHILPLTSIADIIVRKGKKAKKIKSSQKDVTGKVILQDNIAEFSVGLDALNEIHENLEKELRQSKFLYGMIETLQDGFISGSSQEMQSSDDSTSEYKLPKEEGKDLEEHIHLSKPSTRPHSAGLLDEILNSEDMFVSFNEDVDVRLPFDSLEQYSPSPCYDSDYRKVKGGSRFVSTSCTMSRLEILQNIASYEEEERNAVTVTKVESMKDKLFKQELQMKICKTMTSDELKLKQEQENRSKLLKWIQKKKSERQKQYLEDLGKKREAEHHPFVSKSNVSGRDVKHNVSTQAQIAKCLLEENNQERLQSAARLAESVISKEPASSKGKFQGNCANNRYNKANAQSVPANNVPPIPETRASKIRKSALISHIVKNQQLHRGGKHKRKRRVAKPINEKKNKSKKGPASVARPSSRSANRNEGLRKSDERFDFSGRHSVEAHEFVTRESYDGYVTKSSKLLQETMHEYKQVDNSYDLLEDVDFQKQLLSSSRMSNLLMKEDYVLKEQEESSMRFSPNFSLNSSTNNNEVKGLLTRYGMNVDKGLFEKTSGTSQLLVEVDLALLDDSDVYDENSLVNEDIDWDEIDKIIHE